MFIYFQTIRHNNELAARVETDRIKTAGDVMKDFYATKKAIAIKQEEEKTERFRQQCKVQKQAIKSNEVIEVIETTRANAQTTQIASIVDGKKHCVDRTTAAVVQINAGRVKASMHQTDALVKINGYFYFIILNLKYKLACIHTWASL